MSSSSPGTAIHQSTPGCNRPANSTSQPSPSAARIASAGATMVIRWLLGGFSVSTQPVSNASQNQSRSQKCRGRRTWANAHTIPMMNNVPLTQSSSGIVERYQKVGSRV